MSDIARTTASEQLRKRIRDDLSFAHRAGPGSAANPWLTTTQRFIFKIEGVPIGTFTEVSGLNVEIAVERISEGGQNQLVHQRPGRMTWPNIVLKRGVVNDDNLFNWFTQSSGERFSGNGNVVAMFTGVIELVTDRGDPLRAWSIDRAFPVKWTGPSFAVTSSDIPTEELEIAHHGFRSTTSGAR